MKPYTKNLGLGLILILFIVLACTPGANKSNALDKMPMGNKGQRHFLDAYMAYAAAGIKDEIHWEPSTREKDAIDYFTKMAKDAITDLIGNTNVKSFYGTKDIELAWGPVVTVENLVGITDIQYTPTNLMYCLKMNRNDSTFYKVGIAGTNMLSPYDWFTEDFGVRDVVGWTFGPGNVAKGSNDGFRIINAMIDKKNNVVLPGYLSSETRGKDKTEISVSGHSLGGALTQVYSSYLQSQLEVEGKVKVSAYSYAGPSAGDSTFAAALVKQVKDYNAYENTLDMVPHFWQADEINQLCDLYNDVVLHKDPLGTSILVNSAVGYLRKISKAHSYTSPGTPNQFTYDMKPLSTYEYDKLNGEIDLAEGGTDIDDYLDEMYKNCGYSGSTDNKIRKEFFHHMYVMATQHTSAYFSQFISSYPNPRLARIVNEKIASPDLGISGIDEAKDVIEQFLDSIAANNIVDCDCN